MLDAYGVRHMFGLCGDTTLPFYDALARLDHGITHFLTPDERHAAYMADGYARVTGRPGVCEGPSGGGAIYNLPGVVEANESSVPVHAAVARAFGVRSWTVEDPALLVPVLREAIAHPGPSLVDVIAQPLHEAAAPVSEWVA